MKIQRFTPQEEQRGYKVCNCKKQYVIPRDIKSFKPESFIHCTECCNFVLSQKDFLDQKSNK